MELLHADLVKESDWVLSGSLCDWGDFAIPLFTLVIFLWIPSDLRLKRLREREIDRYGIQALSPGGWFYQNHLDFMDYASAYEMGGLDIRSKTLHEQWIAKQPCPVLRIEIPLPVKELVNVVVHGLHNVKNHQRSLNSNG